MKKERIEENYITTLNNLHLGLIAKKTNYFEE